MNPPWIELIVALGVGLLVGVERERRKGQGPQRGAAGVRTFALVTLAGALAQSLAPGALVAIGALAVAPLAALLAARERMHRFATEWLTEIELRDALVLAAVALVVVPLAPTAPWPGLSGLAPRTAAWLVLIILAIQAAAHLAQRLFGERQALRAAGLLGGFVSSTATIATFGARARAEAAPLPRQLAAAAGLSGAATRLQALALAAVLSPMLLPRLVPIALAGAGVALAAGLWVSTALAAASWPSWQGAQDTVATSAQHSSRRRSEAPSPCSPRPDS